MTKGQVTNALRTEAYLMPTVGFGRTSVVRGFIFARLLMVANAVAEASQNGISTTAHQFSGLSATASHHWEWVRRMRSICFGVTGSPYVVAAIRATLAVNVPP